jgi:hypothetical protein
MGILGIYGRGQGENEKKTLGIALTPMTWNNRCEDVHIDEMKE